MSSLIKGFELKCLWIKINYTLGEVYAGNNRSNTEGKCYIQL